MAHRHRAIKKQSDANAAPGQAGSGNRQLKMIQDKFPKGNILYLQQLRECQRKIMAPRATLPVEFTD